ncbi:hypothetical protein LEP1GSC071_2507 [Leptospira santarosai str. JET]|uniref:Uncharacterized protein n=1 Tax=Leptospira santarosai serovar Shermani str. LT 821 TaxID=758847 RepID=K8Y2R4_9LEPT|nr:hypothetical protein LEP1GSC071_2507 [Leptospira santarosai str. JET]EKT87311.1 hypothetical protein LSS_08044 [Leptospira santarosai serovar Shermani str. LT 821]EPG81006.1 hypothetical protein LEP1GSC048_2410 [Leptospira santarosai serovar Shermani str. 1342KT]
MENRLRFSYDKLMLFTVLSNKKAVGTCPGIVKESIIDQVGFQISFE